jgi:hypothetical protein
MGTHDTEERRQMQKKGKALPPNKGSTKPRFPISDAEDLRKAIKLAGHAKGDQGAVRAYIKRRAAALGLSSKIPDDWK